MILQPKAVAAKLCSKGLPQRFVPKHSCKGLLQRSAAKARCKAQQAHKAHRKHRKRAFAAHIRSEPLERTFTAATRAFPAHIHSPHSQQPFTTSLRNSHSRHSSAATTNRRTLPPHSLPSHSQLSSCVCRHGSHCHSIIHSINNSSHASVPHITLASIALLHRCRRRHRHVRLSSSLLPLCAAVHSIVNRSHIHHVAIAVGTHITIAIVLAHTRVASHQ